MTIFKSLDTSLDLDYPTINPTLDLNFALTKTLDPRITFTRNSIGTYVGADGYIKTAVANEPRFDHDGNGKCLGLMIEDSRTNSLPLSEGFTTGWHTARAQVTTGQSDPFGGTNAILVRQTNGTSTRQYISSLTQLFISSNFTVSVFVKYVNYDYVILSGADQDAGSTGDRFGYLLPKLRFQFSTETIAFDEGIFGGSSTLGYGFQKYGNGWYRLWFTRNFSARNNYWGIAIQSNSFVGSNDLNFVTGNNTSSVLAFGFQVEAGSFLTSYIPTSGSTVTRAADSASITGTNFSSWYNTSEGTLLSVGEPILSNISSNTSLNIIPSSSSTRTVSNLLYYPKVIQYATLKSMNANGYSYPSPISTTGLLLNLDAGNTQSYSGSGTTWTDLSGNSNNGTLVSGVGYNSANGGSLVFDGVDDYVTLGNDKFKYQDNFTVEAIARFPNVPNNAAGPCGPRHPIVYNHDFGYNLLIGNTGQVSWQIYNTNSENGNLSSLSSVVGSNYFHVVGIKSGTTISLYVNGVFQSSTNLTTNAVYYINEPFVIGGFAACGGSRFYSTGNISKVSVYNRALSASEVQQNFNALRGRYGI